MHENNVFRHFFQGHAWEENMRNIFLSRNRCAVNFTVARTDIYSSVSALECLMTDTLSGTVIENRTNEKLTILTE